MDYSRRTRLKILGRAEIKALSDEPALAERLIVPGYRAVPERLVLIHLAGLDWNCQQHINPRWNQEELVSMLEPMQRRLQELEVENALLRQATLERHSTLS